MRGATIGKDCNICDHSFIEGGAKLGNRVTVKNSVLIWDKVTIEDEVFLGPNMVFTNDMFPRVAFKKNPEQFLPTLVRKGASIGANATIVCGITVGEQAFVGAGTVVIEDIPSHGLVVGNPGRRIGWICACGTRLTDSLSCSCARRYRIKDAKHGLALI
jgi:acetyltransferase-like isoleucine patch superfamily enzyme